MTVMMSCSSDDNTLENVTVFNKLTTELSWSIDHGFDEVSYIQFFNVQNNKEMIRNYLYPSYDDCYIAYNGFVSYEHESDYESSIVTILENSSTKFAVEYDIYGDGMFYHKVSLFEENDVMIKSWQNKSGDGSYGTASQKVIIPSNVNPESDINLCF